MIAFKVIAPSQVSIVPPRVSPLNPPMLVCWQTGLLAEQRCMCKQESGRQRSQVICCIVPYSVIRRKATILVYHHLNRNITYLFNNIQIKGNFSYFTLDIFDNNNMEKRFWKELALALFRYNFSICLEWSRECSVRIAGTGNKTRVFPIPRRALYRLLYV